MSFFISVVLLGIVKRMPCNGQDLCMSCSSWMLFFSLGRIKMKCRRQVGVPFKLKSCACQASSAIFDSSTSTMKLLVPSSTGSVGQFPLIFTRVPCKVAHSPERSKLRLRTAKSPGSSHWYRNSFTSTWHWKCQAPLIRNHFRSFTAAGGVSSLDTAAAWTSSRSRSLNKGKSP